MTIKEVKEMFNGKYADVEVYEATSFNARDPFHTDAIRGTEDYSDDSEVIAYDLKDKTDYLESIGANCDLGWEWEDCYNPDDRILCIKIGRTE